MLRIHNLYSWSAGLPKELREEIRTLSRCRKLRDGEKLYDLGEPASEVFEILSGRIKVMNFALDGSEMVVGELYPGDWAGTVGMIDGLPRANVALTSGPTEVAVLARADFHRLFTTRPELAQQICVMLCGLFRMVETLAEDAFLLDIAQRLKRMLVRLAHSAGTVRDDGSALIEGITQEDLANRLGATRQSISRELKQLQGDGQIEVSYGRIRILDLDGLTQQVDHLVGIEPINPAYRGRQ